VSASGVEAEMRSDAVSALPDEAGPLAKQALMRKVIQTSLVAIAALSVNAVADGLKPQPRRDTAARYTIDSARTVVSFEVRSFGFLRHRGRFRKSSGSVSLNPQADEGKFDVVIDARSIQAGNDAELKIMRGAGFLNIEKFPEISYKSEHVSFYDGEPIRVDGELTLVGVTHPVPLRVNSYHCTDPVDLELRRCMIDATAIFRRSEFGITGSMPLAGDKVRLAIHAEATADAIPAASGGQGPPRSFRASNSKIIMDGAHAR
jgi:polyisoprenoid-binding protein YceI